ncbi:sensor histidine kinase [Amycolatopsis sp. NPDC059027]|uniref:sensor histidine kinase n=1 Tax=Amycolatopsis sp. NPDC059027 TaxID=3346709 RepID=UPI00366E684E
MRPARGDPEARELRRARRLVAGEIAVVITLLVFVSGVIAFAVLIGGQRAEAERTLAWTIRQGLSVPPPGCVRLFSVGGHVPPGEPPAGMPVTESFARVPADGDVFTETRELGGMVYTIRTENHGGVISQAFFEQIYQLQDRYSLLTGFAVAEALALVAAVLTGYLLAGRVIRPLGEALRRQRTFVADASHELRAPLTRLHTRAQLLSRRTRVSPVPPRVAEEVDQLVSGTRELGEVVDDLLLSARLRAEPPRMEPVELGALAEQAVAAEAVRAGERNVRISVSDDGGAYVVPGVPTALRRVLSALLDNAIGHTPPGGTIEVTLGAPDERHVELCVRDSGVGFEQRDAPRLFERFARGTEGDGRRFGLGLALVREVVAGHGGTIAARGVPGAGATFTLRFLRA